MGVSVTPFIMNLWGGIGPQGEKVCSQLLKVLLGHSEGWTRIQRACEFYQRLSLALMTSVGRQLRALGARSAEMNLLEETSQGPAPVTPEVAVHSPYAE